MIRSAQFILTLTFLLVFTPFLAIAQDSVTGPQSVAKSEQLQNAPLDSQGLHALDWFIIFCFIATMMGVGAYYARRTETEEDYMLGGRTMNPLMVGLSMFASLLSTITYLSLPGEMIKHGPMIISQYLAFPLVFLIGGFVLIPAIMKCKVTSAYEILELRLGRSVRVLGSLFFLVHRFLWMALVIYATSDKILAPLLKLDPSMTPLVCAILGMVTIAYTSMGGLRAVVVTDVMQTAVLFGGAILTLAIITIDLGGVGAWFPKTWAPEWDPVKVMFDPDARLTILGAMTSLSVWYLCTIGADQMAIQRYLATKNTVAARRVLLTSICTDICVGAFLAFLGLALWAYFLAHPEFLPGNYQNIQDADALFPRFIGIRLPVGISGLVIAGLLAAAMSSLSSGVNSSSLVITADYIEPARKKQNKSDEKGRVKTARYVTVFIGVAVVGLSLVAGKVEGNLLEVAFKMANLIPAPLFVLFFMAFFVPWATATGTIVAGLCSLAMAVAIAYGNLFGLSFIWIMPLALLTGVIVGPLVSLFPWGNKNDA